MPGCRGEDDDPELMLDMRLDWAFRDSCICLGDKGKEQYVAR